MTRTHMNTEEREAMRLLDLVRAGVAVAPSLVWRALIITGDAVGVKA